MQNCILEIISEYGYPGIFLLILTENIFPPIPSEAILLFGGFMTTLTSMTPVGVIAVSTLGSLTGALILYFLGSIWSEAKMKTLLSGPAGRFLKLYPEDVDKAVLYFKRQGLKAVFIGRCIPIIRSLISIPAGFCKMKLPPFILLTILGSLIWNTILVTLGVLTGKNWSKILAFTGGYGKIVIFLLLIVAVLKILEHFIKSRHFLSSKK